MTLSPIDGARRTKEQDDELNRLFAQLFNGPGGEVVMNYLASITINNINGPGFDPNGLAHLEGQRFLYGIIRQRINEGNNVGREREHESERWTGRRRRRRGPGATDPADADET